MIQGGNYADANIDRGTKDIGSIIWDGLMI